MRISDWSSDVCSSDLVTAGLDALCDQRLCAGGLCCDRFGDRADLADHINAGAAQTLDQRARRTPEQCDDRYPQRDARVDLRFQQFRWCGRRNQVDAEATIAVCTDALDLDRKSTRLNSSH